MSDWAVLCIDCGQEFYPEEEFGYCWQCENHVCDDCLNKHFEKYCEGL